MGAYYIKKVCTHFLLLILSTLIIIVLLKTMLKTGEKVCGKYKLINLVMVIYGLYIHFL